MADKFQASPRRENPAQQRDQISITEFAYGSQQLPPATHQALATGELHNQSQSLSNRLELLSLTGNIDQSPTNRMLSPNRSESDATDTKLASIATHFRGMDLSSPPTQSHFCANNNTATRHNPQTTEYQFQQHQLQSNQQQSLTTRNGQPMAPCRSQAAQSWYGDTEYTMSRSAVDYDEELAWLMEQHLTNPRTPATQSFSYIA